MIRTSYRGFDIEVSRERAMGGWENLYYSVFRERDGRCMEESFTEGEDSEEDFVGYMKERVDRWCDQPEQYSSEDDF